jgi:hypothetical protein
MTQEQKDKILAINAKNKVETPVEAKTEVPEATEAQNPPAEEVVPKESPKVEEPKAEVPKTEPIETPANWDEDETKEVKTEPSKFDFSKLGSALELGEIKDESDFISKVSQLKSSLKEVQEKPLAGIPEEFKEVIEVAKTGDWKDYLASQLIDYTKLDPVEEFENDFLARSQSNPKYFTDGKYDPQKAEDALDAIVDPVKEMRGSQILQEKAYQQAQIKQQNKAKAQAKLEAAEKALTTATRDLNDLLPFKDYGIKFEPKHSAEVHNGIVTSKLTKELLGVSYEDLVRSGADMKAVAKTIAAAKYAEKMLKFKSAASKTEAKKELLAATQNAQIKTPGSPINPTDPEKKTESTVDKMKKLVSQQLSKGL